MCGCMCGCMCVGVIVGVGVWVCVCVCAHILCAHPAGHTCLNLMDKFWSSLVNSEKTIVWLARPSHLNARGAKGKGRSSISND